MARTISRSVSSRSFRFDEELYAAFQQPAAEFRPFVRWWWNGNRVQAEELRRELRLLHAAGVGGVEINPVKFPEEADPLDTHPVEWLSTQWIDLLKVAFDEAKRLGMVCDLIVGSGWPFGGEYLQDDERGEVMVIAVKKISGPCHLSITPFELLREADPPVNNPYPGRTPRLVSLQLVPDPLLSTDSIIDLSDQKELSSVEIDIPSGAHALYAFVRVESFMQVINGVKGANGPTLNHFNAAAVEKYLNRMSDRIETQIGPLKKHIRALFIDGLELEGANWCSDMRAEFTRRRGYDPLALLPLTLYKTGGMGNVSDYRYGVEMSDPVREEIGRLRYDFCRTQAELLEERFFVPFNNWCHKLGVRSRVQAYGRGVHPLNSALGCDIPEGESWTTNWLKHKLGEEMGNEDYRRGRGYTMINKFMSSGAHLAGKRVISAEEMTNTYLVFSATLDFLKLGSDQSIFSGVTHAVLHGFNYSPPEAPFPGWIRYGAYYNEQNPWWSYMQLFMTYKGRVSALLQQADMYSDIGILPPVSDMWTTMGMQNEPFPSDLNVPYYSLLWEAIHKHGGGCDYLSDEVIAGAKVEAGKLCFGPKRYSTLFLVAVERMHPEGLERLAEFVRGGGRLLCIDKVPCRSLGWHEHEENDRKVRELIAELNRYPDRFVRLAPPQGNDFMGWYPQIQRKYGLKPYVRIASPDTFLVQNRFCTDNGTEIFFLANTHRYRTHRTRLEFAEEILRGRNGWIWNPLDGSRSRITPDRSGGIELEFGPSTSLLVVFDKNKRGIPWHPPMLSGNDTVTLKGWSVGLHHCREKWTKNLTMETPTDLKETEFVNFAGELTYRTSFTVTDPGGPWTLNFGRIAGIAEVRLNGELCATFWCGNPVIELAPPLREEGNELEVRVTTTLGNYMRTLKENPTAQKWTAGRKTQPTQSMGLLGPVTLYRRTRDTAPTRSDQK